MNKKKIIIAYPAMMIGGSTTSLLSILNRLDYDKYDVDLLLNTHTGELLDKIPSKINLLPPLNKYVDAKKQKLFSLLSPRYMYHYIVSKFIAKKSGVPIHAAQYLEYKDVELFRKVDEQYDVAIAFLEGKQCKIVANHINAKCKIAWIHINYIDSRFNPEYDRESMAKFDKIVLVSQDCKTDFDKIFPELSSRTCAIENILSTEYVRSLSDEECDLKVDKSKINLVTTCRINFRSKGLDRAVEAMGRLKQEGKLKDINWYLLGDGQDMVSFKQMIEDNNLTDVIHPLGMQKSPIKYLRDMSMFFLPSRFEGKPMAVTEAFMMGLPVLATEYSSAREQIRDGVDGYICENSTEGVYQGLSALLSGEIPLETLRENVLQTDYSNNEEMQKVIDLIEDN